MPLGHWPDVTIADARRRMSAIVVPILDGVAPWETRAEDWRCKPGITRNDAEWLVGALGAGARRLEGRRKMFASIGPA